MFGMTVNSEGYQTNSLFMSRTIIDTLRETPVISTFFSGTQGDSKKKYGLSFKFKFKKRKRLTCANLTINILLPIPPLPNLRSIREEDQIPFIIGNVHRLFGDALHPLIGIIIISLKCGFNSGTIAYISE